MKAIILARVSTEEQMNEGQSIPAQLARAREYVSKKNFEIQSEYKFNESSLKDQRVKFEEVIKEIKKSKEKIALIVETVDRLQRSFKESVMLEDLRKDDKLELHFIRENLIIHKESNSSEIQRWDLAVFVAKSFVLQISDNVKRSQQQKIKNGEINGKAPIGYLNITDENGNKDVIIDPHRGPYIQKIFELYSTGNYSMQTLASHIGINGLRSNTPSKNKLKTRQIESILKNPFYYGQLTFKGELYPHRYEPLIGPDLFKACTKIRENRNRNIKINSKPFIFKGLMKCKKCGCAMTPEIHKGKYIYYSCTNYKKICKRTLVPENDILNPITELLNKIALPQDKINQLIESLRKNEESKNNFHKQHLARLKLEAEQLDKNMSVMYQDRLDGRLSPDTYDKMVKEKSDKLENINSQINNLAKANKSYYLTANQVLSLAQRAAEIFESSEVDEKRQLLNFLFSNLKMQGKKLHYELKTPFKSLFLYNTKTPPEREAFLWGGIVNDVRTKIITNNNILIPNLS